jgi:hypothetical protein
MLGKNNDNWEHAFWEHLIVGHVNIMMVENVNRNAGKILIHQWVSLWLSFYGLFLIGFSSCSLF